MVVSQSYARLPYFGVVLYLFYGMGKGYLFENSLFYKSYVILCLIEFVVVLLLNKFLKMPQSRVINHTMNTIYLLTLTHEHIVAALNDYQVFDVFSILLLSVAITYTFWMRSKLENLFIHIMSLASIAISLICSSFETNRMYLFVSFFLLSTWKFVNDFYFKRFHEAYEKDNKLQAYKETVGLLNHEFNNVNNLSLLLLKRRKKEAGSLDEKEEEFEKVLVRTQDLIQDLNNVNDYQSEEYIAGSKITKIKNQTPPRS